MELGQEWSSSNTGSNLRTIPYLKPAAFCLLFVYLARHGAQHDGEMHALKEVNFGAKTATEFLREQIYLGTLFHTSTESLYIHGY